MCPFLTSIPKDPTIQRAHVHTTHLSRFPQVSEADPVEGMILEPVLTAVSDAVVAIIRVEMSSTTQSEHLPHLWADAVKSFPENLKLLP